MVTADVDVAIIGAGPYGLSTAAHLRQRGLDTAVFGRPMSTWCESMPKGMRLKSEPAASNLSDQAGELSLATFCRETGVPYEVPLPVGTFIDYGLWFQHQAGIVPQPEVERLAREQGRFVLDVRGGARVTARRAVVAVGIRPFPHVPDSLAPFAPELVSHCSSHPALEAFSGQRVAVVGAGQSALESAALLHESGARVEVLASGPSVKWNRPPEPGPRTTRSRALRPASGLGPSWPNWLYCRFPGHYRRLPPRLRESLAWTALGPAGAWWLRDRVVGKVALDVSTRIRTVTQQAGGVRLGLEAQGQSRSLDVDHVLLGTGYRVDLRHLRLVDRGVLADVRLSGGAPVLDEGFGSSVPGLSFIGPLAASTFGPLMRFVFGADFAARTVSRALAS